MVNAKITNINSDLFWFFIIGRKPQKVQHNIREVLKA